MVSMCFLKLALQDMYSKFQNKKYLRNYNKVYILNY